MIVLDASAGVSFLLRIEPVYPALRERILLAGPGFHVPQLFDLEVLHTFRRYERQRLISAERAERAFARLGELRCERHPSTALLGRIWQLRSNMSTYDATYIALAETLNAPLITLDAPLSRAPGHRAKVEFYGERL